MGKISTKNPEGRCSAAFWARCTRILGSRSFIRSRRRGATRTAPCSLQSEKETKDVEKHLVNFTAIQTVSAHLWDGAQKPSLWVLFVESSASGRGIIIFHLDEIRGASRTLNQFDQTIHSRGGYSRGKNCRRLHRPR